MTAAAKASRSKSPFSEPKGIMSTTPATPKITPFVEWLENHRKGEVDTELTHHLRELIEAVQETGKKGTLTLTLTVNRLSDVQVEVLEDVKVKVPEATRPTSIYFVDQHINLRRDDPRQSPLPFKRGLSAAGTED